MSLVLLWLAVIVISFFDSDRSFDLMNFCISSSNVCYCVFFVWSDLLLGSLRFVKLPATERVSALIMGSLLLPNSGVPVSSRLAAKFFKSFFLTVFLLTVLFSFIPGESRMLSSFLVRY